MFVRALRQKSAAFAPCTARSSVLRNQTARRLQSTASAAVGCSSSREFIIAITDPIALQKAGAQDAATHPLLAGAVGGLAALTGGTCIPSVSANRLLTAA